MKLLLALFTHNCEVSNSNMKNNIQFNNVNILSVELRFNINFFLSYKR